MATKEEQIAWLRNASVDELLEEYDACYYHRMDVERSAKSLGVSTREIREAYSMVRNELVRRLKGE